MTFVFGVKVVFVSKTATVVKTLAASSFWVECPPRNIHLTRSWIRGLATDVHCENNYQQFRSEFNYIRLALLTKRFSTAYRIGIDKTKIIPLTIHNRRRQLQHNEPIRTGSKGQQLHQNGVKRGGNACKRVSKKTSNWMKKWREVF